MMVLSKAKRLLLSVFLIVFSLILLLLGGALFWIVNLDPNDYRSRIEEALSDVLQREVTITGDISLEALGWTPVIGVQDVRVANADWLVQQNADAGALLEVGSFYIRPSLSSYLLDRTIEIQRVHLADANLAISLDDEHGHNLPLMGSSEPSDASDVEPGFVLPERLPVVTFQNVQARFAYMDGSSGHVFIEEGSLSPLAERGLALRLSGAVDGQMEDYDLAFPFLFGADLGADNMLTFGLETERMTALGRDYEAVRLEGRVDMATLPTRMEAFDLAIGLRDNPLFRIGHAQLDFGREKLHLDIVAEIPHLDIDAFMASYALPEEAVEEENPEESFLDYAFPQGLALPLDLVADLHIGLLSYGGAAFGDVHIEARTEADSITILLKEAGLYNSRMEGSLEMDFSSPEAVMDAAFSVAGWDYGTWLKENEITELLQGQLDLGDMNISAQGGSMRQMLSVADGRLRLRFGPGVVNSRLVDFMGGDLLAQILPGGSGQSEAQLNCAVLRMNMEDGRLESDVLLIDTQHVTIGGQGRISLDSQELAWALRPRPKSASLINVPLPIRIYGNLSAPEVAVGGGETLLRGLGAIALGVVAPPAAIIPFVALGNGDENACVTALQTVNEETADPAGEEDADTSGDEEAADEVVEQREDEAAE